MTHPLLRRQLRKLGLDPAVAPTGQEWRDMLERVERAYCQADQDRYTIERSLQISSAEMTVLYEDLRRSSASLLRAERDKLQTIIASLAEGLVVIDAAGAVTSINPEGSRMLGRLHSEALGQNVLELLGFGVLGPSEQEAASDILSTVLEEGQTRALDDARFVHEDGSVVEVSFQMSPIVEEGAVTGAALVYRDISDAKAIERQLRRNESTVRGLYSLSTGSGELSARIVELLAMGCRRFGTQTGLLSRIEGDRICVVEVAPAQEGPARGDSRSLDDTFDHAVLSAAAPLALHDAGASRWSGHAAYKVHGVNAYIGALVVVDGQPYGTLSFRSDVALRSPFVPADRDVMRLMAEWVGNELSREQARADLEAARDEAEAASRAKSTFLANMSHEIRTPLNGVIGMLELLLDEPLDARARDCATTAKDASSALLTVINDILDVSKIEAGKMEIERIPFDPHRLMGDIARIVEVQAAAKGLRLVLDCEAVEGFRVAGDPSRLRQVLNNFCANALKFTDTGGLELRAVLSGSDRGHVRIRFEVADSGIGIAPERIGLLFEEFIQADASTTRRFGGTGLGLAISRQLVELMGGEVGAESSVGAGSTFWAEIPFEVAPQTDEEVSAPRRVPARVVLCGDSQMVASCRRVLRSGDVHAEEVASLAAAERIVLSGAGDALVVAVTRGRSVDEAHALARRMRRSRDDVRLVLVGPPAGIRGDAAAARRAGFDVYLTGATEDLLACVAGPLPSAAFHTRHELAEAAAAGGPSRTTRLPEGSGDVAGLRILVAEDNPVNRRVAEGMLDRLGCETVLVPDGAAAVEAVATGAFDLVFMDCHMPVMDGFEASRALRCTDAGGDLPIVALTASATTDVRVACLDAGMDSVLTKPYTAEQLLTCLLEWARPPAPRTLSDSVCPRDDF